MHLAVFEFLRNRNFDANDFFANRAGSKKPAFTQNNFGTAIGRVLFWFPGYNGKNKTFWFFNYEGFRQRQANTANGIYPSAAQMAGNLADDSAGTGIFPPSSPVCQANPTSSKCHNVIDPATGIAFPGNVIPGNRLDPIVQKQLPYQPKPNVGVPANSAKFPSFNTIGFPKTINDWDQYNVRIDHHLTSNDLLYGTFSDSNETLFKPALRPLGGDVFPQTDRLYTLTYTRIVSPTMVNEFRFGYNRSLTVPAGRDVAHARLREGCFRVEEYFPESVRFWRAQFQSVGLQRRRLALRSDRCYGSQYSVHGQFQLDHAAA